MTTLVQDADCRPPQAAPSEKISSEKVHRVNSIVHGDCLDVLGHVKNEAVDLTVFSPPYDSIRDDKSGWSFDYTALGKALHRVSKDGGICAVVIGGNRNEE